MSAIVGIPTLNGPDRLRRAVASVREHSPDVRILISDDASSPDSLEANKRVAHEFDVPMLMTDRRLGVPAQWNRLTRHYDNVEVVALINDDVEVTADWLDALEYTLRNNLWVGMAGLRCETGVTRANAVSRPFIDYHEAKILQGNGDLLSSGGACFAFRRAAWEEVGGFDERYLCFYEELDFGVSLSRKLGFVNVILDYPVVYHTGGATVAANHDANAVLLESRRKFSEKWGMTLEQLRAEMRNRAPVSFVHWNSQIKNWRHP